MIFWILVQVSVKWTVSHNTSVLHCSALIGIFLYPREKSRVRFGSITGVILKQRQSTWYMTFSGYFRKQRIASDFKIEINLYMFRIMFSRYGREIVINLIRLNKLNCIILQMFKKNLWCVLTVNASTCTVNYLVNICTFFVGNVFTLHNS